MDSLLPKTLELAGSKTILTLETKKQFKRNAHTALKTRRKSALTKAVKARLLMKRRMKASSSYHRGWQTIKNKKQWYQQRTKVKVR